MTTPRTVLEAVLSVK